MRNRRVICAALSALFLWNGTGTIAEESLILIEEEEAHICAAAVELGMAPLIAESLDAPENIDLPSLDWFEEKGLTLGESTLAYPALREGVASETLRTLIDDRILEDGHLRDYVTRISQLISGGKLNVSWRGEVLGPVFSFEIAASGAVESLRNTWVWTGGSIDLRDGHEVRLEELVTDPEAARLAMEEYLEYEVAPELSAHLQNSQLAPLPELFLLSERGIIWKYSMDQLSTLSDRAGDVLIPWRVLRPWLNLDEGSILQDMGILSWIIPWTEENAEEEAALIREMTAEGAIPGIPARLGDSMQDLTDTWRMLIDPDVYALGRFFSLEGAAFQGTFLMTDFLSESWDTSVVDGIRVDTGSVYGLVISETTREAWRKMLGEPDHMIDFDEEQAEAYRTAVGSRDYYAFGGHRLQLHADENGVLVSVILSE